MTAFFAWLFIIYDVLLILIAVPMIRGRFAPNSGIGLRTEKTISDEAVWYPANAYAGRWLFGTGAVQTAVAASILLVPIVRDNFLLYVGVNMITALVGTFTTLFISVAYSEKL